ncbi:hypothetical protein VOLCADRAFT_91131 [Volvox carteri f. nagariensis]|uniref:Uncharacterized protein n=1 Tax=Volvox carteri f. nagariensis TaxID=3068 RepID=D8TW93_VOLCA|nr:uncharacterized protein VOLCADRAFT_91131 [Volvox carteri f. nagariensis]EFJ48435.1 hypothetical protein VOLCADRAFT_91131 [Volvox carteri f. nagariensis]|eukprot:XP_002950689.1 hypothetical protein VOLCADRAFT_91131 [Volvox carteri f. nagariensis]
MTCFLRTKDAGKGTRLPQLRHMECLLMSPTRRTGKKPPVWQWDYSANTVAAVPGGPVTGKVQVQSHYTSPDPVEVVTAAVGALRVGTPAAVACGHLMSDA